MKQTKIAAAVNFACAIVGMQHRQRMGTLTAS